MDNLLRGRGRGPRRGPWAARADQWSATSYFSILARRPEAPCRRQKYRTSPYIFSSPGTLPATYTEYEAMVVTPDGSIIDILNVSRRRKPETDPDWEEREAERKAAKARRLST